MKHLQKSCLILLFATWSVSVFPSEKLTVISYNILKGMSQDTTAGKQQFVDWVRQKDPDILALQEVNLFTQTSLEEMARKFNHPYAVLLKEPGYPVALTSKYPIVNVRKVIDNLHHGFLQAEINGYQIIVLHLSPHKYWKRREEANLIISTIAAQPSQKRWIVMGDFNSLSILDAKTYADGRVLEKTQANMKKYSFHDNLVDGALDFEVQNLFLRFGLIDALKLKHEEFVSSLPTELTSQNGKNPPSRIDYIYLSKDLKKKVKRVDILKDPFTHFYSDHYPVYMEISN